MRCGYHAAAFLDALGARLVEEVQGHRHADLLVREDPLQVEVHDGAARRMDLDVLDDRLQVLAVEADVEDAREECLLLGVTQDLVLVQHDRAWAACRRRRECREPCRPGAGGGSHLSLHLPGAPQRVRIAWP